MLYLVGPIGRERRRRAEGGISILEVVVAVVILTSLALGSVLAFVPV